MVQVLLSISLAPTAGGQLAAATGVLGPISGVEWVLTAFTILSLSLSVILFFWVSVQHKRATQELTQKIIYSAATNAKLKQETDELKVTNRRLEQIIADHSRRQEEVVASVTGAINT
ncbi:MAG: hypothetical protein ISS70_06000 [Phycisphaerae bacterium]|nr:hypothetical protein [Phycisphaerae bacterium]